MAKEEVPEEFKINGLPFWMCGSNISEDQSEKISRELIADICRTFAPNPSGSMARKPVLGYWKVRGGAHPIRFLLKYLNVDFEDRYHGSSFPRGNLDFKNAPYWLDTGVRTVKVGPIIKQIVQKYGKELMPPDHSSQRRAQKVENDIKDIQVSFRKLVYSYSYTDEACQVFLRDQIPKFNKLQEFIGDSEWVTGTNLSYLDFLLYETLYQLTVLKDDIFKDHPRLTKLVSDFEALPAIASYLASPDFLKGPIFPPGAKLEI